jgi:hypothetical protein
MRKRTLISTVLAIALCTLAASAEMIRLGGSGVKKSSVLLGLPGVHVKVILRNPKELKKYITSQQHLRTKAESLLRRRQIKLFSEDELTSVPGEPVLEIRINLATDSRISGTAINLRLRLVEDISLVRDYNIRARTAIWESAMTGLIKLEELEDIGEIVEKRTDVFCDLYDKANPRSGIDVKD